MHHVPTDGTLVLMFAPHIGVGMDGELEKSAFKSKFYSHAGLPVNHVARIILSRGKNDGDITFPSFRSTSGGSRGPKVN